MSLQELLISYIQTHQSQSSMEIHQGIKADKAYATTKRALGKMVNEGFIVTEGKGKSTKYLISLSYQLFFPVDVESYFEKEIDERQINEYFSFELLEVIIPVVDLFTNEEQQKLDTLQQTFKENVSHLSASAYQKEMERLAIDLSWKSSQIEGNTYSLLETERLLKEHETAAGKPKDDATMLLNHKEAINFITEHPDDVQPLRIAGIEDLHSILVKDLGVDRNIRTRRVGVTGTNYKPLDNEYQIREALEKMCVLVNAKENVFEKALLLLILLSYIQSFGDGNKRTARIISNAILMAHAYCPISFRTVDAIAYKKAMLIFYEQNNLSAFKRIFIEQFEFAVKTYF